MKMIITYIESSATFYILQSEDKSLDDRRLKFYIYFQNKIKIAIVFREKNETNIYKNAISSVRLHIALRRRFRSYIKR